MSILDEALERQLRKLRPLPKVVSVVTITTPEVPGPAGVVVEAKSIRLAYQEGSSDKVYFVQVVKVARGYEVHFQYGRRGNTLITGTKTSGPVSLSEATGIYYVLIHQKKSKGYKEV